MALYRQTLAIIFACSVTTVAAKACPNLIVDTWVQHPISLSVKELTAVLFWTPRCPDSIHHVHRLDHLSTRYRYPSHDPQDHSERQFCRFRDRGLTTIGVIDFDFFEELDAFLVKKKLDISLALASPEKASHPLKTLTSEVEGIPWVVLLEVFMF